MITINLAEDFSRYPGGRYRSDGPHNGEEFREDYLVPALRRGERLQIVLDDVAGLPASFIEEAFGGLIRAGFSEASLRRQIEFVAQTPRLRRYPAMILSYIQQAAGLLERAG